MKKKILDKQKREGKGTMSHIRTKRKDMRGEESNGYRERNDTLH